VQDPFNTTAPAPDRLAAPSGLDLESEVVAKLTWRLVPFLFLLYIVAYLDRINVGFAALQMQQDLHFNDAIYGAGAGMFFWGYLILQVPSNLVLQRLGAKRWIAILMIAWGVISSAMIFVTTPRSFYFLRFLLGAAEAGFFPGVILYLKAWFPASARARTVARFMTAGPLSGVVGGPVSGMLLNLHHRLGLSGWQWLFLLEGLPAIVLGGVVLVYLTNRPEEANWLSDVQRNWLLDTLRQEEHVAVAARGSDMRTALLSVRTWMLVVLYFGLTMTSYGISMFLPKLIQSVSGVSNLVIGLLSAIPYVAAAVAMVLVGLHSDRTGERRWHVAVPAFAGALALGVAAYSNSVVPLIAGISVALLGVFSIMGPFWAMPTSFLSGTAAAVGIALINSVGNLGGYFGPRIIGQVRTATGQYRGGLLVIGTAMAISGVMAMVVKYEPRK
jgi:ACS family tartrate transporter-like MFS transporter